MSMVLFQYVSPILASLIVLANILEIYLIRRIKRRQTTPSTIYILNLSITDLFVGLNVLIIKLLHYMVARYPTNRPLIEVYAVFVFLMLRLSLLTSILNLMVITIDRILAVKKPVRHRSIKPNSAIIVCLITWFLAGIILSVHYTFIRLGYIRRPYQELMMPVTVFPSVFMLFVSYMYILSKIRIQRRRTMSQATLAVPNRKSNILIEEAKKRKSTSEKRRLQKEWNVVKLAIMVVIVFTVCWLPVAIYGVLELFYVTMDEDVIDFTFCVAIANSLLNPLIYFHHIRTEGKKLMRRCFVLLCCKRNSLLYEKEVLDEKLSTASIANINTTVC